MGSKSFKEINMKKLRPMLLASLAIGAIVLTQTLSITPASANNLLPAVWKSSNPQLIVSGAIIEGDVVPGTNYTHTMTISTRSTDPPMDVLVDVKGLGQTPDGAVQALDAANDTSSYSAREYITLDNNSFHLDPGASAQVVASINIPADVGTGGRYAVIYIHNQPVGTGQVGIVSAINVPVYLTIKGTQLIQTGKITSLPNTQAVSGDPVDVSTLFQNTGNIDFKVKAEVTIQDAQGKILDTITTPVTSSAVVPGLTRRLDATFIPQGNLALGTYSVQSKVMKEDGTVLDQATGNFNVEKPYVPPPPAASITLNPASAATLATDDGRISIFFLQGSITGEAKVSIQSYSPSQLPTPKSGITLGTTCFRVDGLTGLLVKKATVTVKYSSADMDKAGGDATKLELARWDEGQSGWTVLKTKVNTQASTLAADTNQFSIWAVVVTSSQHATINLWEVIGGAAAGVIIIVLLVYFFILKMRIGETTSN
jgi:hypothetical protein